MTSTAFAQLNSMKKNSLMYIILLFASTLVFQNCSDVNFQAIETAGSSSPFNIDNEQVSDNPTDFNSDICITSPSSCSEISGVVGGIKGGHFDVDTYSLENGSSVYRHIHEYDEKTNSNFSDLLNYFLPGGTSQDSKENLVEINGAISTSAKFKLIILNRHLNTSANIYINGKHMSEINSDKVYTLSGLSSLKVIIGIDAIAAGGIVPTTPKLVKENAPGPSGEYRAGALVIQAVNASGYALNPSTGEAIKGLLWESTYYYHFKDDSRH